MRRFLVSLSLILLFSLSLSPLFAVELTEMTLDNGMKVVHIHAPQSKKTADIVIAVKVGSEDERRSQAGISHLLEHIIFQTRTPESEPLNKILTRSGGSWNGWTSPFYTSYMLADLSDKDLLFYCSLWARALLSPRYPPKNIFAMERQVVLEEMLRGIPDDVSAWKLSSWVHYRRLFTAFSPDIQYPKWSPIGFRYAVGNLSLEEVGAYQRNHYTPKAMTLVITTSEPSEQVKLIAEESFGKYGGSTVGQKDPHTLNFNRPSAFTFIESPTLVPDDIGFLLGFKVPGAETYDGFVLEQIALLLEFRLSRKNYKRFQIEAGIEPLQRGPGPRIFVITGQVSDIRGGWHEYQEMENEANNLLNDLLAQPVDETELAYLLDRYRLSEARMTQAELIAHDLGFSTIESIQKKEKWLSGLTSTILHEKVKEYLNFDHAVFLLHGEQFNLFEFHTTTKAILVVGCFVLPLLLVIGLHFSWSRWLTNEAGTLYLVRPLKRWYIVLTRLGGWFLIAASVLILSILTIQIVFFLYSGLPIWSIWSVLPILLFFQLIALVMYSGMLFSLGRTMPAIVLTFIFLVSGNNSLEILDRSQNLDFHPILRMVLQIITKIVPPLDQLRMLALDASLGIDPEHVTWRAVMHCFALIMTILAIGLFTFSRKELR